MQVNEFVEIYNDLARLYPGRMQTDNDTLDSWYRRLNDIPAVVVRLAVDRIADDPSIDVRYPPNALQIRRLAKQSAGVIDFNTVNEAQVDQLRGELCQLENIFYTDGRLESVSWERLIRSFETRDRCHAADNARRRYDVHCGKVPEIDGSLYANWNQNRIREKGSSYEIQDL